MTSVYELLKSGGLRATGSAQFPATGVTGGVLRWVRMVGPQQNEHSFGDRPRRLAGGTIALILLSTWFLSATAMAGVRTACGQDSTVQADREISQARPGQQAADSTEVSRSTAGVADAQSAQAQTGQQNDGQAQKQQTEKSNAQSDEKKGEWVIAPIPINSPAIGAGLEWAVARVFPLNKKDKISPPSAVGIGGVFTNNGSRAVALGGRLYLKEDKYRIASALGGASINADIYGIGKPAGDRGTYVPINAEGGGSLVSFCMASGRACT